MAVNHLSTLKEMCVNADISNNIKHREALGWALARLMDLTGTKVGEALWGHKDDPVVPQLRDEIDRLNKFASFICDRNRVNLDRMKRQFDSHNDK